MPRSKRHLIPWVLPHETHAGQKSSAKARHRDERYWQPILLEQNEPNAERPANNRDLKEFYQNSQATDVAQTRQERQEPAINPGKH